MFPVYSKYIENIVLILQNIYNAYQGGIFMKYLYSPQPVESISLEVEWSPVWELTLGIAGYTYEQLRHTFDMDKKWVSHHDSMSATLVEHLKEIKETNFWYGLLMLQNKLSASSVQEFSNLLTEIPIDCFYETLLPYKERSTEQTRKETATQYNKRELFNIQHILKPTTT